MRLGGPVGGEYSHPEVWVAELVRQGYRAAYCPRPAKDEAIMDFVQAAADADILIAEVGAWSNPLSADPETKRKALQYCKEQLALAERIGARCCVNISGSRGEIWDGPHPDNLTVETFDIIVETVREIIDAVQPKRTFYTLETMPWMYPDSSTSYLRLIQAIDRPQFAVHLDPVNMICSPQLFFENARLIRDCFGSLGPYIKSCHAKDVTLSNTLLTHLEEVRPGLGSLNYRVFLEEMAKLSPEIPLMLEHLSTEQEYMLAADYIRSVAHEIEGARFQ